MLNPQSLTITGASAVVPISATTLNAKWVKPKAPAGNSGTVRVGGPEVTSTVGWPLEKGESLSMDPNNAETFAFYDLSQINVYVATGDTLVVLYGG